MSFLIFHFIYSIVKLCSLLVHCSSKFTLPILHINIQLSDRKSVVSLAFQVEIFNLCFMLLSVLDQRILLRSVNSFCKGIIWWFFTTKSYAVRCPAFSKWEGIPDTVLQWPVLTLILLNGFINELEKGLNYEVTEFLMVLIYSGSRKEG